MRKLTAVLCAVVLTFGMAATVFANPSISTIGTEKVTVSAETAAKLGEGMSIAVKEAAPENYENAAVAEAVKKLNDNATKITMTEILAILKVDAGTAKTESGKAIDLTKYEPITKFADLVVTDGASVEYDVNGEVISVEATITLDAVKGAKAEELLIMQLNPKTGDTYFIEFEEDKFDAETGEVTVTFPCLGPFTVLEKTV